MKQTNTNASEYLLLRSDCKRLIVEIETNRRITSYIVRGYVLVRNSNERFKLVHTKCYGNLAAAENDALEFLDSALWVVIKYG